jgi:hypothetical protein
MNIYLMKPLFKPDLGLFAAKKVQYAAKRSAFWC